jgi:hypothetical protein
MPTASATPRPRARRWTSCTGAPVLRPPALGVRACWFCMCLLNRRCRVHVHLLQRLLAASPTSACARHSAAVSLSDPVMQRCGKWSALPLSLGLVLVCLEQEHPARLLPAGGQRDDHARALSPAQPHHGARSPHPPSLCDAQNLQHLLSLKIAAVLVTGTACTPQASHA